MLALALLSTALVAAPAPAPVSSPAPGEEDSFVPDFSDPEPSGDTTEPHPPQIGGPRSRELSVLPRTGQQTLAFRLPDYPRASSPAVPVGETLEANGVPMNVRAFTTADDPRVVLAYYKQVFGSWHLPMLGNGDLLVKMPYPSVTVFDEANGVDLSVIAIPGGEQGKAETTVLLALADVQDLKENVARTVDHRYGPLPAYPEGNAPQTLATTDGERQGVMVSFDTADAPEQVLAYYQKQLGEGVRVVPSPLNTEDDREVDFVHGQEAWRFRLHHERAAKRTLVQAIFQSYGAEEKPWEP